MNPNKASVIGTTFLNGSDFTRLSHGFIWLPLKTQHNAGTLLQRQLHHVFKNWVSFLALLSLLPNYKPEFVGGQF